MDDMVLSQLPSGPSAIQLIEGCGEWYVRIVEEGKQASLSSFDLESYALAYAEVQRTRLGLAEIQIT